MRTRGEFQGWGRSQMTESSQRGVGPGRKAPVETVYFQGEKKNQYMFFFLQYGPLHMCGNVKKRLTTLLDSQLNVLLGAGV